MKTIKNLQVVSIGNYQYVIIPLKEKVEVYPQIVIEKMTTGEYELWQVDNIHDFDLKNQYQIVFTNDPQIMFPDNELKLDMGAFLQNFIQNSEKPIDEVQRMYFLSWSKQLLKKFYGIESRESEIPESIKSVKIKVK